MTSYHAGESRERGRAAKEILTDPYLTRLWSASTVADLVAIIDELGITEPNRRTVELGRLKLERLLLRRLAND